MKTEKNHNLIKFEHSEEYITGKTGLLLYDEFWKRYKMDERINRVFGLPGSNRGIESSIYIRTIIELLIDGGSNLEDVRKLENDEGYKKLVGIESYPSSDAIGDWLRRQGEIGGEKKVWEINSELLKINTEKDLLIDVDATIIESDKGDGTKSYKGIVGYHPLVGMTVENGMCIGTRFRYGHEQAGEGLLGFIQECEKNNGGRIKYIRSDSAGYNHDIINYCNETGKYFTITADKNISVMRSIEKIEKSEWKWGKNRDGSKEKWKVAETIHSMDKTKESFRLVIKRTKIKGQIDLFDNSEYRYWVIATNMPEEEYSANAVILHHYGRGEMERLLGEFKYNFNLDQLPCGQFTANSLYFAIGALAYNIVQLIKKISLDKDWLKKSIRSIRYNIIHLPSKVVTTSRYLKAKIVCAKEDLERFLYAYSRLRFAPS
jgi:hypothetical protein